MRSNPACKLEHEWIRGSDYVLLRVTCRGPQRLLTRMPQIAASYGRSKANPRGLSIRRVTTGYTLGDPSEYRVTYACIPTVEAEKLPGETVSYPPSARTGQAGTATD